MQKANVDSKAWLCTHFSNKGMYTKLSTKQNRHTLLCMLISCTVSCFKPPHPAVFHIDKLQEAPQARVL